MPDNLIFYDTETTGIHKDFSQIIQCGSILTDSSFNIKGEQNISSRPLPWVIPQPKAMLTNKKINSFTSNTSHYQMMKDIQYQWKEWCIKFPSIFTFPEKSPLEPSKGPTNFVAVIMPEEFML